MCFLSCTSSLICPPPLPSLACTLWQLCWWWLCAHGASWLRGPRWPTWQLLMFRCSTPLTQRPWSNTHAYVATDKHRSTMRTHVYTLWLFTCINRSLYSCACCQGAGNKVTRTGEIFYAYGSQALASNSYQSAKEKTTGVRQCCLCMISVVFMTVFFCAGQPTLVAVPSADTLQMCLASQGSCSWHSCLGRMSQILSVI